MALERVDRPIPDVALYGRDGAAVELSERLNGRKAVVIFLRHFG